MEGFIQSPNGKTFIVEINRSFSLDGYDYMILKNTGDFAFLFCPYVAETIAEGQIKEIDLNKWRLKHPHRLNINNEDELAVELSMFLEDNYDRYVGYYD